MASIEIIHVSGWKVQYSWIFIKIVEFYQFFLYSLFFFYNQPALKKNDEDYHHPTGNLPPTVYTVAERQMADHLASHQFVTGIEGGFDSDGKFYLKF